MSNRSADVRPVSPARGPETVRRDEPVCAVHGASNYPLWPCGEAVHVAALIEARDAQIRADECEQAAATVRARVTADNADIGPIARRERALERRAIVKALRHRAAELAHRLAQLDDADAPAHPLLATLPTDETDEVAE